ncbi:MAG: hypothetical protein V4724_18835 [Pseudomonadota bacterium]
MRCESNQIVCSVAVLAEDVLEADSVIGLAEWMALQAWRANWRPEPDPARSVEALGAVFRRVLRIGYAAYLSGAKVMPTLFALDSTMAQMWQEGFALARVDARLGIRHLFGHHDV